MEEVLLSAARELNTLCDRAFWATEADSAEVVICFQFNANLFLVLGYLGTWYHAFWAKEANAISNDAEVAICFHFNAK